MGRTFYIAVLFFLSLTPLAHGQNVVHLVFGDAGHSSTYSREFPNYVKAYAPGAKLTSIKVSTAEVAGVPRSVGDILANTSDSPMRAALSEKLRGQVDHIMNIDLLVVATHGSSDGGKTSLTSVGSVSASTGPDEDFKEFFEPLRGKLKKDAGIILDACSTFCGDREDAGRRAVHIQRFFGIENGRVYGTLTDGQSVPNVERLNSKVFASLSLKQRVRNIAASLWTAIELYRYAAVNPDFRRSVRLPGGLRMITWLNQFATKDQRTLDRVAQTKGLIFQFKNGRLDSISGVSPYEDHLSIFKLGKPCGEVAIRI